MAEVAGVVTRGMFTDFLHRISRGEWFDPDERGGAT